MAKVNQVKKAYKDVLTYEGKQKLSRKETLTDNDFIVKKGESYYWWSFRFGGKHYSKTYPKRSQLTQSDFLSQLYDLEDRISESSAGTKDDFDSLKEEFVDEIENLSSECEDKLNNMPEQLQSSSSGETLQERIDALQSWSSDIESIECEDYDEAELREEIKTNNENFTEEELEEAFEEKVREIVDTALEELKETASGL
jgi:hypothetical protein